MGVFLTFFLYGITLYALFTDTNICHSHKLPSLRISRGKWALRRTTANLLGTVLSTHSPHSAINLHYSIVTWPVACMALFPDLNVNGTVSAFCLVTGRRPILVLLNIEASARPAIIGKRKGVLSRQ
jgi:hypothetical protein